VDSRIDEPNWDVLGRYAAGEATAEEQQLVRQWLAIHPEDERFLAIVSQMPASAPPLVSDFEVEAALRRVRARRDMSPARVSWRGPGIAAAAVIAALGLWGVTRMRAVRSDAPPVIAQTYSTQNRNVDTVTLADGSRVILAPNSTMQLADGYDEHRTVSLTGQAYFDVVHDDGRPFTVLISRAHVRDVGTSFDVSTEPDSTVVVRVVAGVVDLKPTSDTLAQGVRLHPGDRGRLYRDNRLVAERGRGAGTMEWTHGGLTFRNASMPEVRSAILRWYGVDLQIDDSAMVDRHLTATFTTEPIDQVLHIIALALGATIERSGNSAILHSAPPEPTR
jgi:transmembrane sensor